MKQFLTLITGLTLLVSCKSELDFPFDSAASVNYYLVSDVLETRYTINSKTPVLGVFLDGKEQSQTTANTEIQTPDIPYLNSSIGQKSFPFSNEVLIKPTHGQPFYMAHTAAEHAFLFAFTTNTRFAGTPFFIEMVRHKQVLMPNAYYTYYFADAPVIDGEEAAYKLIVAQQPRQNVAQQGKVAVRLINLSADAGALSIKLQQKNNTGQTSQALPQALSYGQVPDYVLLDTAQEQDGLLVFNVYNAQTNQLLLVGSVPAATGHSFEVLLHGFINEAKRSVATKYDTKNGPSAYQTLTIAPNFRATVRQTF